MSATPARGASAAAAPAVDGEKSAVEHRGSLRDEQQAAPRPDVTVDTENTGDDNRFVTPKVSGDG